MQPPGTVLSQQIRGAFRIAEFLVCPREFRLAKPKDAVGIRPLSQYVGRTASASDEFSLPRRYYQTLLP